MGKPRVGLGSEPHGCSKAQRRADPELCLGYLFDMDWTMSIWSAMAMMRALWRCARAWDMAWLMPMDSMDAEQARKASAAPRPASDASAMSAIMKLPFFALAENSLIQSESLKAEPNRAMMSRAFSRPAGHEKCSAAETASANAFLRSPEVMKTIHGWRADKSRSMREKDCSISRADPKINDIKSLLGFRTSGSRAGFIWIEQAGS